jgi:hypothetical protein
MKSRCSVEGILEGVEGSRGFYGNGFKRYGLLQGTDRELPGQGNTETAKNPFQLC